MINKSEYFKEQLEVQLIEPAGEYIVNITSDEEWEPIWEKTFLTFRFIKVNIVNTSRQLIKRKINNQNN